VDGPSFERRTAPPFCRPWLRLLIGDAVALGLGDDAQAARIPFFRVRLVHRTDEVAGQEIAVKGKKAAAGGILEACYARIGHLHHMRLALVCLIIPGLDGLVSVLDVRIDGGVEHLGFQISGKQSDSPPQVAPNHIRLGDGFRALGIALDRRHMESGLALLHPVTDEDPPSFKGGDLLIQ